MRKKVLLFELCVALILSLTACGTTAKDVSDPGQSESVGASALETPADSVESEALVDSVESEIPVVLEGSGSCGGNVTWSYSNGVFTVEGTGPMDNYHFGEGATDAPWDFFECAYEAHTVRISDGVTSVGDNAFCLCPLANVIISDTVTSIGEGAFSYCYNLSSVIIPNSVTSIGEGAFESCKSLISVVIPDSVTSIGYEAFYDCGSLTDVYYIGSESQWEQITFENPYSYGVSPYGNESLTNATIHFSN